MKKAFTLIIAALFSLTLASAQEAVLFIPAGPVGTLNKTIAGDTLANGTRTPNRVYELQRGAPYLIDNEIGNVGFPLHIRARAGAGTRPIIIFASTGTVIEQLLRTRANAKLEGLHLSGKDNLAGGVRSAVRLDAAGAKLEINDCLIDDFAQTTVRLNVANTKCFITNSYLNRMGSPKDPDNGRVIDDRGNPQDSIVLENNVIYNVTSRVIRNQTPGSIDNYVKINQNTIWGTGQRCLQIGKVKELVVTNNILQNCAIFGRSALAISPATIIEADTTVLGQNWTVRNNNVSSNPQVIAALPARIFDSIVVNSAQIGIYSPRLTPIAQNTFTEVVTFKNAPVLPDYLVADFRPDSSNLGNLRPNARDWNHSGITADANWSALGNPQIPRFSTSHDFAYGTWRPAYRNGTTGQPLGANLQGFTTNTSDLFDASGVMMYPNPVSDILYVGEMDKAKINRIEVVSITGQAVQSFNTEGVSFLQIPTQTMSNGVYFLKMTNAEGKINTRKFVKQ